jgi:hypothetical protein
MILAGSIALLALAASAMTASAFARVGHEYTGNYTGLLDTGLTTEVGHEYTGNYTGSLNTGLTALDDDEVQATK